MNASELNVPSAGWRADLRLRFAARDLRTYLIERSHSGPLIVQRPFYPEGGVCHVYIVHPPGGVVGGDELSVRVKAEPGSSLLLTTPAAAKFYRSEGAVARQTQLLEVSDASLEWLPQESIFFNAANVRSTTRVCLDGRSRFIGCEIACLGLPAREEDFADGTLRLGFEVEVNGAPHIIDRLRIDGDNRARTATWGLAAHKAIGTLLAYPAEPAMCDLARHIAELDVEIACSLVDEVLVCRALGTQAELVRLALTKIWHALRPRLMNRAAIVPRIWKT
jgi:urease accessory protein